VGRLVEKKGFDLLVRACARLRDRGVDYTCKIIGGGPQHGVLSQLINELELGNHVCLVGPVPFEEVKGYYRQASLLVMPSRISPRDQDRDGLPNVIIEAMATGVPVVATELAGIPDLVIPNQTGLLVPPEDVTELAGAMQELLENDGFRMRLACAGRARVEQEFDLAASVQKLEALIHRSSPFETLEPEFAYGPLSL
jgi:glycosyltransferase involved in cell wall biosynthesis